MELWRSDGTTAGTFMLKDLNPGDDDAFLKPRSDPWLNTTPDFRVEGDSLYFTVNGKEAWQTDGTPEGTIRSDHQTPPPENPLVVRFEDTTISYEEGTFYRTRDGHDEIVAIWTNHSSFQPAWIKEINGTILFNPSSTTLSTQFARLYSFNASDVHVDAGGPYDIVFNDTASNLRRAFASDLVDLNDFRGGNLDEHVNLHRGPGYLVEFNSNVDPYPELPVSHFNVLGNNERSGGLGPTAKESITLGFPSPLVSAEGHDLVFGVDATFQAYAITASGKEIAMGRVDRRNPNAELPNANEPIMAVKLRFDGENLHRPEYGNVSWVEGKIDAAVVLTASGDRTPDAEFIWDLNNDGIFDRLGRSVGLSSKDLSAFGLDQPGEYTVRVRMNDRVSDYFDTAIIRVLEGEPTELSADINLDGRVAFDDFLILAENFAKQNATRDEGDLNGDQTVDFLDFLVLANDFGNTF